MINNEVAVLRFGHCTKCVSLPSANLVDYYFRIFSPNVYLSQPTFFFFRCPQSSYLVQFPLNSTSWTVRTQHLQWCCINQQQSKFTAEHKTSPLPSFAAFPLSVISVLTPLKFTLCGLSHPFVLRVSLGVSLEVTALASGCVCACVCWLCALFVEGYLR